jgi:hypothetical protein
MRSINVLMRGHCIGDFSNCQVRRKGLLQQNAVYAIVVRKRVKPLADGGRRRALRKPIDRDVDADALAGALEISHVGQTRFILADEDDAQFRVNAGLAQRRRARNQLGAQIGSQASSVENQGGHAVGVSFADG